MVLPCSPNGVYHTLWYGQTKDPTALKHFSSGALNFVVIVNRHSPLTSSEIQDILQIQPQPEITARLVFQLGYRRQCALSRAISKIHGLDGISVAMLNISAPVIIPYLVLLINKSLREWVFPSSWKFSLLNPLLKSLSPISPSNTRPIALLPEVSKILERVVFAQLYEFVESNNLMGPYQSCYKKGHGT